MKDLSKKYIVMCAVQFFSSIRVKNRRFGTSLITWIGAEFFVVCCHYVQETTVANEYHIPYVRTGECFGAMN
jgi:hypothetical protein